MRRFWAGCLGALWLCVGGTAQAGPSFQDELGALAKDMAEGRCDLPRLKKITARREFAQVGGRGRSTIFVGLAMCDTERQHEHVMKAIAEPDALAAAFSLRFADATLRGETAEAVAALETAVARKDDGTLTWFDDNYVYKAARDLKGDTSGFARLAASLDRADWRPTTYPYYGGDWIWGRYAGLLAAQGDRTQAWRVASRVEEPGEIARMSLDKRLDAIMAIGPKHFDVVAAAEARLARGRELLAKAPRDGSALALVLEMLRFLGRQSEGLALVDPVLASPEPIVNAQGKPHRNWIQNDRALLLVDLGRYDEAIAGMRLAADEPENGGQNVSQTINLAGLQLAAGQNERALATLEPLAANPARASPYGAMWVHTERACALGRLGRAAEAAKALAFTAEHAKDNWNARTKALLCADDLEALAEAYKTRLADEATRTDALLELSRFRQGANPSAFDVELGARMEAVRRRPDVQAAAAAVGRTRDFPIHAATLIDTY